jgi:hypothetical protein
MPCGGSRRRSGGSSPTASVVRAVRWRDSGRFFSALVLLAELTYNCAASKDGLF